MSLYNTFKTDESLETKGIELEYGHTEAGEPIRIRIARAGGGNTRFAKVLEEKTRPYRRQLQTGTLDKKVSDRLYLETFAETVVLGWVNMEDETGAELPFNVSNVCKLFTDLPDLYNDVQAQAQSAALFRAATREIAAKN
jgi:hypothetical protein